MPYRRRRYAPKRRFRRGGRKTSGFRSALSMAARAWSMAKYIKSLVNVEKKYLDTTLGLGGGIGTTAYSASLSAISEGSDYNQRDGISVKAVSLFVRMNIRQGPAATLPHSLRVLILIDKEGLGTAPVIADVLEASTDFMSPLNHVNGRRFNMLFDKTFHVSPAGNEILDLKVFKRLSDHIRWSNSTTGTREGHIYIFALSDTATAAEEPQFAYDARLRYIDN